MLEERFRRWLNAAWASLHRADTWWAIGEYYLDWRALDIPCGAAPGDYMLVLGVFRPEPLRELAIVRGDDAAITGYRAFLTTLTVPE
ncbi:MAG: hypothetical protein ACLFTK_15890 [Anaerolineales bacterium]